MRTAYDEAVYAVIDYDNDGRISHYSDDVGSHRWDRRRTVHLRNYDLKLAETWHLYDWRASACYGDEAERGPECSTE